MRSTSWEAVKTQQVNAQADSKTAASEFILLELVKPSMVTRNDFLYRRSQYHGQVKPEHLAFNTNLQEFARRVGYIAGLQTGGKMTAEESFEHIKILWTQFELASCQSNLSGKPVAMLHESEE